VLGSGRVPLPFLAMEVESWIEGEGERVGCR
jgi:hypothetical protein